MASLSDIVNVTVSTLTAAIKSPGFGIPMILDYHTRFSELIRFYSGLDEMVDDGFLATDSAYQAAAAAFAQDPQLNQLAIGRRQSKPNVQIDLVPTVVNSKRYEVTVQLPSGSVTSVHFDSDSTATLAEICVGLAAAIDALTGVDAASMSGDTFIRVTPTSPGAYYALKVSDKALLQLKSTGADSSTGTENDLDAIRLVDDTWYGLTLTTQGATEIAAASHWAESNEKLLVQASQDGDIIVSGSGDVASTVKTANRFRTALIFSHDATQHAGAAWLGAGFPIDPGGLTFANLTLASVDTEALTGTNITQLKAKNCNYMTNYGNVVLTRNGVVSAGEYIDIIRDRDWYRSQLQTEVLAVMVNNNKVPFTDRGIAQIESAVRRATKRAIDAGFLAEGTDTYVVPLAADVSPNDRANRTLGATPIKVNARVAGAIHVAEIRATITA